MWGEIMSHCDSVTCVNLILSNKFLYDSFKERLKELRFTTLKVMSRQAKGLNFYRSPLIWKKMGKSGICINKVYIKCSRGGSAKTMWVNLCYNDVYKFLRFMGTGIFVLQDRWPERINVKNICLEDITTSYINHSILEGSVNKIEWDDSLLGRSIYIARDKVLNDIISDLENKLSVDNDSFDMDMYCSIKSRRRIRLYRRQKNESKIN